MKPKATVIGAGFAGISAATNLAGRGWDVTVLEKNDGPGGRARQFSEKGFTFDMGPSWYWMPDVFEEYFGDFGASPSDYYELERLDPAYQIFFGQGEKNNVPGTPEGVFELFESIEKGSSKNLKAFLDEAAYKYKVSMSEFVRKPGRSLMEFAQLRLLKDALRLHLFQSMHRYVRKYFSDPRLLQILEFPVLFLGATPEKTPALYSMMNHADLTLGTWYPKGGIHSVVKGMVELAESQGVKFHYSAEVNSINVSGNKAISLEVGGTFQEADVFIAAGDYHHIEQNLLSPKYRMYDQAYWEKRTMAPSCMIYYIGVNKKLKGLQHHNLFFDRDFSAHAVEIYDRPAWPKEPLFYVCCPSKTDDEVAPEGNENLFVLIPMAPGLDDTQAMREKYFNLVMDRMESLTNQTIREHIVYQRSYAHSDFVSDYHAFKGNAYGLANTLKQTAVLKPSMKSSKVNNLYYAGQLTVPGPGVPPALISGQVVAGEIEKDLRKKIEEHHEVAV